MPQPAIRAVNLSKRYSSGSNELVIFADLNIEVAEGERLALVGESGAGKSTLLHLLGGLDRPSSGEIWFGDLALNTLDEQGLARFRNRQIGFVWQTHYLLPEFTVLENVMMPLLIAGLGPAEASLRALQRIGEVGLNARTSHKSGELSGGEQQRVVLARALVSSPRVLLADEPTGNLDFRTSEMIMSLLEDLHRAHGLTSVLVTHNLGFARRCDRILQLDKGSLSVWPRPADGTGLEVAAAMEEPPRGNRRDHV